LDDADLMRAGFGLYALHNQFFLPVGHRRLSLSDNGILPSRHAEVNIKMQSRAIFSEVAR
jgi:hypothetical protein